MARVGLEGVLGSIERNRQEVADTLSERDESGVARERTRLGMARVVALNILADCFPPRLQTSRYYILVDICRYLSKL